MRKVWALLVCISLSVQGVAGKGILFPLEQFPGLEFDWRLQMWQFWAELAFCWILDRLKALTDSHSKILLEKSFFHVKSCSIVPWVALNYWLNYPAKLRPSQDITTSQWKIYLRNHKKKSLILSLSGVSFSQDDENKFLLRQFFQICEKYHDKVEVILILLSVYELTNVSECVRFCVRMAYLERFSPTASSALRPYWEAGDTSSILSTPTGTTSYSLITNTIEILIIF